MYSVIEFKKQLLDPQGVMLKTYNLSNDVFIKIVCSRLLIHPPITYNSDDDILNIGVAPFIETAASNILSLYSIALENLQEDTVEISCINCKPYILNFESILTVDAITNNPLKVIRVDISKQDIELLELDSINVDVKAIHPTNNSLAFLSNDKNLYKLYLCGSKTCFESISRCDKHYIGNTGGYTTSLCICSSNVYLFTSDRFYGFSIEFDKNVLPDNVGTIYGYTLNNVHFIRVANKSFISRLGSNIIQELQYDVKPIAILDNDYILGVSADKALVIQNLEEGVLEVVGKVDIQKLLDLQINTTMNSAVLTYNGSIYLFHLLDTPLYVRVKTNNAYSAMLTNDMLLIFKKDSIDIYNIDISPYRIYVECLSAIPKYFVRCVNLAKNRVMCIDKLGRIVIDDPRSLFLSRSRFGFVPLRHSNGKAMYVQGGPTIVALIDIPDIVLWRVNANAIIAIADRATSFRHRILSPVLHTTDINRVPQNSVIIDVIPANEIYVISIGSKVYVIGNRDVIQQKYSHIAIVNGDEVLKKGLDGNQGLTDNITDLFKYGVKAYLGGEHGLIEWGVAVNKANFVVTKPDSILATYGDKLCLTRNLGEIIKNSKAFVLMALCSNDVLKQEGMCLDLSRCEKLLKLLLIIQVNDSIYRLSIPMYDLIIPKICYTDGYDISTSYLHGVLQVAIPKKCVDLINAHLHIGLKSVVELELVNYCHNIGATVIMNGNTIFLNPNERKNIKIDINVDTMINEDSIDIVIYESSGVSSRYILSIYLQQLIAKAYIFALKIAKTLGVKGGITLFNDVSKNLRKCY